MDSHSNTVISHAVISHAFAYCQDVENRDKVYCNNVVINKIRELKKVRNIRNIKLGHSRKMGTKQKIGNEVTGRATV